MLWAIQPPPTSATCRLSSPLGGRARPVRQDSAVSPVGQEHGSAKRAAPQATCVPLADDAGIAKHTIRFGPAWAVEATAAAISRAGSNSWRIARMAFIMQAGPREVEEALGELGRGRPRVRHGASSPSKRRDNLKFARFDP